VRERERQTDRQTDKEIQRERQTDRQTDRQRETERERKKERQREFDVLNARNVFKDIMFTSLTFLFDIKNVVNGSFE
jgi:RNA-binding protein 25